MKATISIDALAMAFASVSAQELRGDPVVGSCSNYHLSVSLCLQTKKKLSLHFRLLLLSLSRILGGGDGSLPLTSSSLPRFFSMSR